MRAQFLVAVHLFFFRDNRILLLRRFNTGWEDGNYSIPAGHVDAGETVTQAAIREAREEIGLNLGPQDLEIVHVMNRKSEHDRIDFFLRVTNWNDEITNAEPDKCDELSWYPVTSLPSNVIPYVRRGLQNYQTGILFSEFGW